MAGTLTVPWQNSPKDNFMMHNHAGWHSAKQIHPDTSLAARLNPASPNQNFPVPKARHIQHCNVVLAVRRTWFCSSGFCILGRSIKSLEEHIWGHVSQDRSLDKMFLYPQVSNIDAHHAHLCQQIISKLWLRICWIKVGRLMRKTFTEFHFILNQAHTKNCIICILTFWTKSSMFTGLRQLPAFPKY